MKFTHIMAMLYVITIPPTHRVRENNWISLVKMAVYHKILHYEI